MHWSGSVVDEGFYRHSGLRINEVRTRSCVVRSLKPREAAHATPTVSSKFRVLHGMETKLIPVTLIPASCDSDSRKGTACRCSAQSRVAGDNRMAIIQARHLPCAIQGLLFRDTPDDAVLGRVSAEEIDRTFLGTHYHKPLLEAMRYIQSCGAPRACTGPLERGPWSKELHAGMPHMARSRDAPGPVFADGRSRPAVSLSVLTVQGHELLEQAGILQNIVRQPHARQALKMASIRVLSLQGLELGRRGMHHEHASLGQGRGHQKLHADARAAPTSASALKLTQESLAVAEHLDIPLVADAQIAGVRAH